MEKLKKQKNIGGDVKETGQIMVETLKKRTNIGGDVKETDKSTRRSGKNRQQIFLETLKKQIFAET